MPSLTVLMWAGVVVLAVFTAWVVAWALVQLGRDHSPGRHGDRPLD